MIGDPRGMVEAERVGGARGEQFHRAEEAAHRGLGLGGEVVVAQRQEAGASSLATDQTIAERGFPSRSVIGSRANGPPG